jgi:CHAD domain-containing protein
MRRQPAAMCEALRARHVVAMSYRFKSKESPSRGLKRIFHEEIGAALKLCGHPVEQRGETVHETRKHLKKLRAALRLAVDEAGKNRYTREDHSLRDIARLVSDLRDAHVRLQTLSALHKQPDNDAFPKLQELLSIERESFSAAFDGWQKQALPRLAAAETRLERWPLDDLTWKEVCAAVAKSYRRGRDSLARVLDDPKAENFHAWRKRVKELWYHLRLLRPLNRVVLEKIGDDAGALGELLGLDHDLAFLLARFDGEETDPGLQDEHAQLEKLVRKRSRKLQRDATELGRRFYAEPPKAFAKRISIFIKDWKAKRKKKPRADGK